MQRRKQPPRLRLDRGHRLGGLLRANHWHAALDDPCLLAGDRRQRVAEKFAVVHADRRDHARERRVDHVGGVEPPAEADFQQHHIGRMLREQRKGRRGFDFKNRDRRAGIDLLAMFERRAQFVVVDENAAAGPAEPEAFVDPHQVRRGVGVDAQARRFQNRPQVSDRRALAVGAGDVNNRRQLALGMAEPHQQPVHPLEIEIDAFGVQGGQPRDQFAERRWFCRGCVHA